MGWLWAALASAWRDPEKISIFLVHFSPMRGSEYKLHPVDYGRRERLNTTCRVISTLFLDDII